MVPSFYKTYKAFPQNNSGKIDVKSLKKEANELLGK
jgi:hypothetical protein